MVQFSKLKLTGFKSFSDSTEIDILDGLTGVIGPNGCGKSNLVESLRWIMGENSPKNMRGGAMDDVIFAGTGRRPPRNFAEVILTLDNSDRKAPDNFNNDDTLEISRRIERGMGSDYRINGKLVRAADVKLFFADTATGAHSPAIVSQGRVADLISAKPTDRRMVLEEAAAISGLHSRRKEAEQRLRAGEKNLIRLDDVMGEKETLYASLKKQARQAVRYRKLSDTIRRVEARMILVEWRYLNSEAEAAKTRMVTTNQRLNAVKQKLFELQKQRETTQETQKEARTEFDTALNTKRSLELEKDKTQDKLYQLDEKRRTIAQQQEQASHDIKHEQATLSQAQEKLAKIYIEKAELEETIANFDTIFTQTLDIRDNAKQKFDDANNTLSQRKSAFAAQQTQREYLNKQITALTSSSETLDHQLSQLQTLLLTEKKKSGANDEEKHLRQSVSKHEESLATLQKTVSDQQAALEMVTEKQKTAYAELETIIAQYNTVMAEHDALEALLAQDFAQYDFKSIIDDISVKPGFEISLGIALGSDLQAGLTTSDPVYWQTRSGVKKASLPKNVVCLLESVSAPKALHLALSQVGVVDNQTHGNALAKDLQPGQILVSKDGYAWRWDGLTITPSASSIRQTKTAEEIFKQKNRLEKLKKLLADVQEKRARAQADYDTYRSEKEALENQVNQSREAIDQTYQALNEKRALVTDFIQASVENQSTIKALEDQITHLHQRQESEKEQLNQVKQDLNSLSNSNQDQIDINTLETALVRIETDYQTAQENYLALKNNRERSTQRLATIDRDIDEWQTRQQKAKERLTILNDRQAINLKALTDLQNAPDDLTNMLRDIDAKLATQAEHLEAAENNFNRLDETLNTLTHKIEQEQEALSNAREALARDETCYQADQQAKEHLSIRCQQQFTLAPEELAEKFDINLEEETDPLETLRAKFERYRNERERIGAVNLRAEEEAQTLSKEIEEITNERQDVMAAINELRQAISKLNRDARKKMLAAFEEVNKHFQSIFKRLFNGGEAHLELIDAEDPLNAGLEIFASPPGKRMQNLSLLSGGEQSLTAIALIFAMFLTTPSPICILDEIDAPLDDANVERICTLLNDFSNDPKIDTRFLIITHNPITMAHVDRLYGVTMAEKGISKLISVDLNKQKQEEEKQEQFELA